VVGEKRSITPALLTVFHRIVT